MKQTAKKPIFQNAKWLLSWDRFVVRGSSGFLISKCFFHTMSWVLLRNHYTLFHLKFDHLSPQFVWSFNLLFSHNITRFIPDVVETGNWIAGIRRFFCSFNARKKNIFQYLSYVYFIRKFYGDDLWVMYFVGSWNFWNFFAREADLFTLLLTFNRVSICTKKVIWVKITVIMS